MPKFSHFPCSKTCVLPFDFALERDLKNIFFYQVLNFCYLIEINIYTRNLPVCSSGQHSYVTGLFNFFVFQDLIDRIDSYFLIVAFRRNFLLINFWDSMSQVFSNVNKQFSWEWGCINLKGEIIAESGWWVSNIKISIF